MGRGCGTVSKRGRLARERLGDNSTAKRSAKGVSVNECPVS